MATSIGDEITALEREVDALGASLLRLLEADDERAALLAELADLAELARPLSYRVRPRLRVVEAPTELLREGGDDG